MKARRLALLQRLARHRLANLGWGDVLGLHLDEYLEDVQVVWEPGKHPLAL